MKQKIILAFLGVVGLGLVYFAYHALVLDEGEDDPGTLRISTPLVSIAYFVKEIGGEAVQVNAILPVDQDYHTLELSPSQVASVHKANAFFTIGTPEEGPLVEKLKDSGVPIFNIATGVILIPYDEGNHDCHNEDGHDHGEMDPHLWLSVSNMSILAEKIASVLTELDPENSELYQDNLMNLQVRLQGLWQNMSEVLFPYKGARVIVMHAAYGYFLEPFHIRQISLESFQRESSFKQSAAALKQSKGGTTQFLFVQPQYNPEQVSKITEDFGLKKISFNPIFSDPFVEIARVLEAIQGAGGQ